MQACLFMEKRQEGETFLTKVTSYFSDFNQWCRLLTYLPMMQTVNETVSISTVI